MCRPLPVDCALQIFFPPEPGHGHFSQYDRARPVCAGCPVRQECAEAHLDDLFGFFAGLTPEQLAAERARRLALGAGLAGSTDVALRTEQGLDASVR